MAEKRVKGSSAIHNFTQGIVVDGKMGTWKQYDLEHEGKAFVLECARLERRDGDVFNGFWQMPDMLFDEMREWAIGKAGVGPFDEMHEVTGCRGQFIDNLRFVADEIENLREWKHSLMEKGADALDEVTFTAIENEYSEALDFLIRIFQMTINRETDGIEQEDAQGYYRKIMADRPKVEIPAELGAF